MAVRCRHRPGVSRLCRRGAHLLLGSGHAGVSRGPREHAQSRPGSKSITPTVLQGSQFGGPNETMETISYT